jgi:hypothetical protein
MEGRSVAPPAATLRPFDCAQGRAVGVFETAVYGPAYPTMKPSAKVGHPVWVVGEEREEAGSSLHSE